eukprot:TRINITY_DN2581_c0_g1_i1.p1 TRINITY_DN2581_c0_g1~~TRINITY_DN2581_c0_g1_i1.p1  ORF type:complete len:316 (-),score=85.55 TRINITY_DN2581_c0_g1_i1:49-996(-)
MNANVLTDFCGIWVATLAPLHKDTGLADVSQVPTYARLMEEQGVTGLFINGTSGEGMSLTNEERMAIAEAWVEATKKSGIKIIVHVGSTSLELAKQLAKHAASLGVAGISALPPCYYKPANTEALVLFCKELTSVAPHTPFFYYHFPNQSGVMNITLRDFFTKGKPVLPTLCGAKFTHNDFLDMERAIDHEAGPFMIFNGYDECFLPSLSIGATGAVGIGYNFFTPQFREIISAFNKGDHAAARKIQKTMNQFYEIILTFPLIPSMKALFRMKGLDLGPSRPPFVDLTPEQVALLVGKLKAIDAWKYMGIPESKA